MNTPPRRLATSLGLTAVLTAIGAVITINRVPGGGALHAQQTSRKGRRKVLEMPRPWQTELQRLGMWIEAEPPGGKGMGA